MRKISILVTLLLVTVSPIRANDKQIEITVAFDYGGDIYITDFSGDPVSTTSSDTHEMIPAWSPDGTQIAFLSSDSYLTRNESYLYVITLLTGEIRQLNELVFTSETTLTWSPDGNYIAATLGTIFIVDVEDGAEWQLPVDCGTCSVNWLSDSSGLIFQSRGEIFSIGLDGENLQQITHAPPNTYQPMLSPVSNVVLFTSTYEDVPSLSSVNLEDLTINQILVSPGHVSVLHLWSPDGHYISISVIPTVRSEVDVPGGADIFVIDIDSTDMRVITGDGYDVLVGWANDSQHIIYYEGEPGNAGGTYFAINIADDTQTRLSNATMDRMCSYGNCRNFVVGP